MAGLPLPIDELAAMAQQHGISDIFYYFESFTDLKNNRTVGRKIGVLQEIIIRKYLERSAAISDRMLLERPVIGISGATHKLEFVVCAVADRLRLARGQAVDYGGIEMELTEAGPPRLSLPPVGSWKKRGASCPSRVPSGWAAASGTPYCGSGLKPRA